MLDPMTALGLVSNIVQLVGFTASLLSETREFIASSSDALPRNDWVEHLAQDNNALAADLENAMSASGVPNKTEAAVRSLAIRCQEEAAVLIALLEPLKVKARPDRSKPMLKALGKALRSKLKTHDIEASQKRLESLERQLCALLLRHIQQTQAVEFEELRDAVERNGRDCVQTVLACKNDLLDIIMRLEALQTTVEQGFTTMEQGFRRMDSSFRSAEERKLAESIVDSLAFPEMQSRYQAITDHHSRTCEWMFSDTDSQYHKWLQTQSSIFWVCGEAGSGKSTLMRYLRGEFESRALLETWAGDRQLMLAAHYFWIPGSPLQKSLEGMLRTLLHQLLKDQSDLLPTACPARWAQTQGSAHMINEPWTYAELVDAIANLGTRGDLAICFFIDGLDECEERSHPKLNQLLRRLSNLPHVKICMSSRPWTAFKREFEGNTETILLHELNLRDIFEYICDRLAEAQPTLFPRAMYDDELFSTILKDSRGGTCAYSHAPRSLKASPTKILIYTTVLKAQAVFLWASIVMDGICTRLVHQTATEVLPYLDDFPPDLETHFERQIFSRIDATYRKSGYSDTAMNLMLALHRASTRGNTVLFWHLRHDIARKTGAVKDERFAEGLDFQFINRDELFQNVDTLKSYLAECCKDLLHVVYNNSEEWMTSVAIDFRHRAAYDFLATAHMQDILQTHVPTHFNNKDFWHQFDLVRLKRLPDTPERCSYASWIAPGAWSYPAGHQLLYPCAILQHCNDALESYFSTHCPHGSQCLEPLNCFVIWYMARSFAIVGRYSWITRTLYAQPWIACSMHHDSFPLQVGVFALACGLDPCKAFRERELSGMAKTVGTIHLDFVTLMLDCGFYPWLNPYSRERGCSWHQLLDDYQLVDSRERGCFWHQLLDDYQLVDDSGAIDSDIRFDLFKTFIEHGADLCQNCREALCALLPSRHHAKLDSLIQEFSQPERQRAIVDARLKRIANYPAEALTSSEWSEARKRGWRTVVDGHEDLMHAYSVFRERVEKRCERLLNEGRPKAERWLELTPKHGKWNPEKDASDARSEPAGEEEESESETRVPTRRASAESRHAVERASITVRSDMEKYGRALV